MECYLCKSKEFIQRTGKVRDSENLKIFECKNCSLVFLSDFSHIEKTHYEESGMHGSNPVSIEEWLKESEKDDDRRFKFLKQKILNKDILDFGCGAGGFLSKASSFANQRYGIELETRAVERLKSLGVHVEKSPNAFINSNKKFDLITAFHVIEHLPDPETVIKELASLLKDNGELIIEVPNSNDALLALYQSKPFSEFTYWSNHLFLFNNESLKDLIKKCGLRVHWMKQIQRYTLSNHLYWLSNGLPGGHVKWSFLDDEDLHNSYESKLSSLGLCDTIIVSVIN
ncbi:MAG: class I SAM-dependent methyltransferase [Leptospira sp.]|nr:class I SAM-dependent methyltransferase [Leptospira sp.]